MTIWKFPPNMTLVEAKAWLEGKLDDGVACPCCGQFAKLYRRKLNSSMARALILFFKTYGWEEQWVHVPTETGLSRLGGDWAKLALWGLIEERGDERDDGGKHSGWWRITHLGVRFVRNQMRIPRFVFLYDGAVMRFDPLTTVNIRDALGDHFDYRELMGYAEEEAMGEPEVYMPPARRNRRAEQDAPAAKPRRRRRKPVNEAQLDLFYVQPRKGPFDTGGTK